MTTGPQAPNATTISDDGSAAPSESQIAALARAQAMGIRSLEENLEICGITQESFARCVEQSEFYRKLCQEYAAEWGSIKSTNKRLAFQAAAALEEKLPTLAHRMGSTREDLSDAIAAAKLFRELAGAGANAGVDQARERFNITINLGGADTVSLSSSSVQEIQAIPVREVNEAPVYNGPKEPTASKDLPAEPGRLSYTIPVSTEGEK